MFPHKNPESIKPGFIADGNREMGLSEPKYNAQKYWLMFLLILDEDSRTHSELSDITESMNIDSKNERHTIVELMLRGYVWDDAIQHGTDDDCERMFSKTKEFIESIKDEDEGEDAPSVFPDGLPRLRITQSGREFLNNLVDKGF